MAHARTHTIYTTCMRHTPNPSRAAALSASPWLKFGLLAAVLGAIAAGWLTRDDWDPQALLTWVQTHGALAGLAFAALYALLTVLMLPGSVLTIASGAIFGPVLGVIYSLTGATLGAALAFLIARYIARDAVKARAGPQLTALMQGIQQDGWRFIALLRLVPLFPFNLVNYASGVTPIKLWTYTWASFVFMTPGAIAYVYVGVAGHAAAQGDGNLITHIGIALSLLGVMLWLPSLARRWRRRRDKARSPTER